MAGSKSRTRKAGSSFISAKLKADSEIRNLLREEKITMAKARELNIKRKEQALRITINKLIRQTAIEILSRFEEKLTHQQTEAIIKASLKLSTAMTNAFQTHMLRDTAIAEITKQLQDAYSKLSKWKGTQNAQVYCDLLTENVILRVNEVTREAVKMNH